MMRRALRRVAPVLAGMLAVVGALLLGIVVAALLLGRRPEREGPLVGPAIAGAAAAVVVHAPLRAALERGGRARRAHRGRTPEAVLATFGERAGRGVPIDELLLQFAEALRRTFELRRAEVWVMDGAVIGRVASVPDAGRVEIGLSTEAVDALGRVGTAGEHWLSVWAPELGAAPDPGELRVAPARHGGQLLGLVLVDRAASSPRLTEDDDRRLGELGRRLGDVLRNRQLDAALRSTLADLRRSNEELRASRARLVVVSDEERRRIERDLHDGAQQHLVALAVQLGLARDVVREDPDAAWALLDELGGDLREAVQQLRDLAHGIYPPALRDGGLAQALPVAARRSAVDVSVSIEAGAATRVSPEIEAALYFCCLEALQNVAKHVPDAAACVALSRSAGALVLEVRDDGPGFDPSATAAGQGLQNMADRLGAVGGVLSVDARRGGGVRVTATVPAPAVS